MDLIGHIEHEHAVIGSMLQECLVTDNDTWGRELARLAATRLHAWLQAEQRVLFPAIVAVADDPWQLPVRAHAELVQCVDEVLRRVSHDDLRFVRSVLHLQPRAARYARHERGPLIRLLITLFCESELRELSGAVRLVQAPGDASTNASSHCARPRSVPMLNEALIVQHC